MNKKLLTKIFSILFSIVIILPYNTSKTMATSDLKIEMKREKIREEEISLDSDEIPLEVRRSIEQLKKDKNVEEISLSIIEYKENQVRNSKMATQLNGWGNPYKGYKNLYYKDWIIKSSSSSNWVLIRENTWGNLKGVKIENIISTSAGLLIGSVNSKAGVAYTISELIYSMLPKPVYTSTKIKFEAKLHIDEKIEKHTYVREGSTGNYDYAALTQKAKYRFQKSVTLPGKRAITNYYTNYTTVETEHFSKPDRKAWNAIYNPWIERLGNVKFGGKVFSIK